MLKVSSYMIDETSPVLVAGGDGTIIAQNKTARRMLGPGTGRYCWDVVGKLEGARKLPCHRGCVLGLLGSGMDQTQESRFQVKGKSHCLSCTPTNGVVVCMLSSLGGESGESGRSQEALSPREREILALLADGETTSSAADRLGVCESTVRTHVERMRSKLCVNTRAAVVAEGFRLGYLD
jgi:DNA-binding CsgD family transcriptional regulator